MNKDFLTAVRDRRTYYSIGKQATVSDERIREIVEHAVTHTPSPFNSQSARVVLLLGGQHDKLWDIVKETLRKTVPPERFPATEKKIDASFRSGYGTVLFFEDQAVVQGLQQQFPPYADNFPLWSLQSSGMHQFVVWTALEAEGLGASLQHYNPLIDAAVKQQWGLPDEWKLLAQMPFGQPAAPPGPKEFKPLSDRVKIFR
jgi:predicted oxidoreductase (fatty acid repression mutant protein)